MESGNQFQQWPIKPNTERQKDDSHLLLLRYSRRDHMDATLLKSTRIIHNLIDLVCLYLHLHMAAFTTWPIRGHKENGR